MLLNDHPNTCRGSRLANFFFVIMMPSRTKRPTIPVRLPSSGPVNSTAATRRPSVSGLNPVTGGPKTLRTSKTTQKLVVLPSEPQTRPPLDEDEPHEYETDTGIRERKSEGERMNKEERKKAGFRRITAYCVAESFKMKILASFLRREHNVVPRVFDDALYVVSTKTVRDDACVLIN